MKRRAFIAGLAGAAALPLAAKAQPAMPVVGFLNSASPDVFADRLRGFHQGLKEAGYIEGDNVTIVYRWAENQINRLPDMAAELVGRRVAVIAATGGSYSAIAAKAASTRVPIVFGIPDDPVRLGLVTNLARPDGNSTGINFFATEVVAKRLELLRELVPRVVCIALIVNPANAANAAAMAKDVEAAADAMGLQVQIHNASNGNDIDTAFATFANERPDAVFVAPDPLSTRFRSVAGCSSLRWPRAMRCRRHFRCATMS
jgi:putative ABC transport system substrate-binding protein